MIESAMLMALGFFAATLLALVILPFVTRRAARLAAERLRDVIPLSVDEIVAERDGLRAAAAVEQRRLEQKAGQAEAALALRDTELGRRTSELAALQETHEREMAAKAALAADLDRAQGHRAEIEEQRDDLQRKLTTSDTRVRDLEQEGRLLTARRDDFEALAEQRRGAIAGLETRCAGLEMRRDDLDADLARNRAEQDKLRAALADMTRDRDLSRTEVQLVATQRAILQDDLTEVSRRAESHRVRLEAKTEALARTEQMLMTERADRTAVQAALDDLRRRFQLLEARLIEHGAGDAGSSAEGDVDALRTAVIGIADQAIDMLKPPPPRPAESGVSTTPAQAVPSKADQTAP